MSIFNFKYLGIVTFFVFNLAFGKVIQDQYSLGPVFSYNAFNLAQKSNGAEANLYSNLNYGLALNWEHRWTSIWADQLRYTALYCNILTDSNSILANNKLFLYRLEWISSFKFEGLNQIKSTLGLYENIYTTSTSGTNVDVNKILVPEWVVGYQRYIVTKDKIIFRLFAGPGFTYSPNIKKIGFKFNATAGINIGRKEFQINYFTKQYETNYLKNTSQELLFNFLYKFN